MYLNPSIVEEASSVFPIRCNEHLLRLSFWLLNNLLWSESVREPALVLSFSAVDVCASISMLEGGAGAEGKDIVSRLTSGLVQMEPTTGLHLDRSVTLAMDRDWRYRNAWGWVILGLVLVTVISYRFCGNFWNWNDSFLKQFLHDGTQGLQLLRLTKQRCLFVGTVCRYSACSKTDLWGWLISNCQQLCISPRQIFFCFFSCCTEVFSVRVSFISRVAIGALTPPYRSTTLL